MMKPTLDGVYHVLGPVDRDVAAQIIATDASEQGLLEAHAWLTSDETLVNELRPLPKGIVSELIELLRPLVGGTPEGE